MREVRRLVPAGSLYYCHLTNDAGEPASRQQLLQACQALWLAVLNPERSDRSGDDANLRATTARDGYGLVLPGLWWRAQGADPAPGNGEDDG